MMYADLLQRLGAVALTPILVISVAIAPACACAAPARQQQPAKTKSCCGDPGNCEMGANGESCCDQKTDAPQRPVDTNSNHHSCAASCDDGCGCAGVKLETALVRPGPDARSVSDKAHAVAMSVQPLADASASLYGHCEGNRATVCPFPGIPPLSVICVFRC